MHTGAAPIVLTGHRHTQGEGEGRAEGMGVRVCLCALERKSTCVCKTERTALCLGRAVPNVPWGFGAISCPHKQ